MRLENKYAIITGGGSGIGQGAALALAAEGCGVCILDINSDGLEQTSKLLLEAGVMKDKILQIVGDITDTDYCKMAVAKAVSYFKKLDILINCAGIVVYRSPNDKFEDIPLENFDREFNVNLRAMFLMCQLAMPHLTETKGNIVNISSIISQITVYQYFIYSLTKVGVDKLTSTLAIEVANRGVRVNSINPGLIPTNIHVNCGMSPQAAQEFFESSAPDYPLQRIGTVKDVVDALLFLVSDTASFVTGHHLVVDGGMSKK